MLFAIERVAFSVSQPVPTANESPQNVVISELKEKAVLQWVKERVSPSKFEQYSKLVTENFSEKYVVKFQLKRTTTTPAEFVLSGELDGAGLSAWFRTLEVRKGSRVIRPIVVFTADLPEWRSSAEKTAVFFRETPMGSVLSQQALALFHKYNANVTVMASGGVPANAPPTSESEWKNLRDLATAVDGNHLVFWLHLGVCRNCVRLDTHLYSITYGREVLSRSDELYLANTEFTSMPRLKAVFAPVFQQIRTEFEALLSSGLLFSSAYKLIVEGIESYPSLRKLETELSEADPIHQITLKRTEAGKGEFEVLSSASADELSRQLGPKLKLVHIEDNALVVKWVK